MRKKHAGGRPPKYRTAKEMQKAIDEYFESCFRPMKVLDKESGNSILLKDEKGQIIMEQFKPYTITGLALALDLDRRSLLNYSEKDEFFPTIKKAKAKVENYLEEKLITDSSVTGIIFNLKNNYDWKDKQENVNIETNYEEYIKKVADEDEY